MLSDEPPLPNLIELSSSDESYASDCSRFLGEEDLIDSLFFTCDIGRSGKVNVSRIVEYLRYITEEEAQNHENLQLLVSLLDPDGTDPEITLEVYRTRIEEWIEKLQREQAESSNVWNDNSEIYSSSLPGSPSVMRPLMNRFLRLDSTRSIANISSTPSRNSFHFQSPVHALSLLSPVSVEDTSTEANSLDMSTMVGRIADLEFQNRRLAEESKSLKNQVELSEETAANLASEVEKIRMEAKNQQATIERLQEIKREREELKLALSVVTDAKKRLQRQVLDTERESTKLQTEINKLNEQFSDLQTDHEKLIEENFELQDTVEDLKLFKQNAKEKADLQYAEINEKTCRLEEMQVVISDLNQLNKSLRKEKTELEQHLTETVQELAEAMNHSFDADQGKTEESDEEFMPVKVHPEACSTPATRVSICDELKSTILLDSPCLHSPLCDKEMDDVFFSQIQPLNFDFPVTLSFDSKLTSVEDESDVESIVTSALEELDSSGKPPARNAHLKHLVRQNKFHLLSQIGSLSEDNTGSPSVRKKMQTELNILAENMAVLVAAKQMSDKRVTKLSSALKRVYEHYQILEKKHTDTVGRLESDCKRLSLDVDYSVNQFEEQKELYAALKRQLAEKEHVVLTLKEQQSYLESTLIQNTQKECELEIKIQELKKELTIKELLLISKKEEVECATTADVADSQEQIHSSPPKMVCKTSVIIESSPSPHSDPESRRRTVSSGNVSFTIVEENNNDEKYHGPCIKNESVDTLARVSPSAKLAPCSPEDVDIEESPQITQIHSSFEVETERPYCERRDDESIPHSVKQILYSLSCRVINAFLIFGVVTVALILVTLTCGSIPRRSDFEPWGFLSHSLWPYVELKHYGMPPT